MPKTTDTRKYYTAERIQDISGLSYEGECFNASKTWELVKELLPNPVTQSARKAAADTLDNYLFVSAMKKGIRTGYCTKCGRTVEIKEKLKNRTKTICPVCHAKVIYAESWRGRGWCFDACYYAFWKRSSKDKNTLFQIGLVCEKDYGAEVDAQPRCIIHDITMFREKRAPVKFHALNKWREGDYVSKYSRTNPTAISSGWGYWYDLKFAHYDDLKTFRKAAKGTQLERCGLLGKPYEYLDRSFSLYKTVALCMRYPSVEYLYKTGQTKLIDDILEHGNRNPHVNLNGKTATDVLGLPSSVLAEVKKRKYKLNREIMKARDIYNANDERYTLDDLITTANAYAYVVEVKGIGEIANISIKRRVAYLEKQRAMPDPATPWDWRDYLHQCKELGMNIGEESISMPKNLAAAHDEMTRRVKYKKNKVYNPTIRKRLPQLKEYVFTFAGLTMRPFETGEEIIDEGTALSHCVGGYVRSYAEGQTILCALRREDDPNTPWHTVEFSVRDGRLIQCRGEHNQTLQEDKPLIEEFWKAFEEYRAKKVRKTA